VQQQVEHWWNGYTAGMMRRDIFLHRDDDGRWTVLAMWWREQARTFDFGHNEAAARLWVAQLKALDVDTDPGRWKDLGPRRRPGRKS
jgi:hypothetical protein